MLILLSYKTTGYSVYVLTGGAELLLIACLSDLLIRRHKAFGWLNDALMLLFNVEYTMLYFSGSFITYVMLQNTDSVQDLAGKALIYATGVVLCVVFTFLPIGPLPLQSKKTVRIASVALLLEVCVVGAAGMQYSPYGGMYSLYRQWRVHKSLATKFSYDIDQEELFYNEADEVEEEEEADTPNVILIFTEGLSSNIITDERNIMPNVAALKEQSISFENYYNHTFATYRGLIGQLYSGYQYNDTDINTLISLQDIMRDQGYRTAMVNTEPYNEKFSEYLENLNFDEVVTDAERCSGTSDTMTDKDAYDLLFETAIQYDEESEEPFFLAIYTFGTHASLNSPDEKYGDGSDRALNKFYNVDYQFGQFLNKFNESELAADTVLIFTADHATYSDEDFRNAFPDYVRACSDVDEIPLFIYRAGVTSGQVVDAGGRNSLDMAPTVLDYLGISAPNYFLGTSLFVENTGELSLDTFFWDPTYLMGTGGDAVQTVDRETSDMVYGLLTQYFSIGLKENEGE